MSLKLRNATILAGIVAGLALAGPSSAALLGNSLTFPLISFDNGGLTNYDATTGAFGVNANPIAIRFTPASPPIFITPTAGAGEFLTIGITVDNAGNLVGGTAGDDLSVFGFIDVDNDGNPDIGGSLLTGEVTGFGYQNNGPTDLYDFTFQATGGALVQAGLFNGPIGLSMQSEHSTFAGSFEESFGGKAKGTLGVIPEPTTLALLGSGVAGLAALGRRKD